MGRDNYKFSIPDGFGRLEVVTPDNPDMEFVHMEYLRLRAGEECEAGMDSREIGLLLMGGDFTVQYAGKSTSIKGRADCFAGLPHCVYVPAGKRVTIHADTDYEAAVFGTPSDADGE